jgi:dihydrofolate synthase/folylpolyglutamate synthase
MQAGERSTSTLQPVALKYPLPLLGAHQLTNSAVAIAALHLLRAQGWAISDEAIAAGIANTQWRGRLQWLDWKGQRLLVDGAHNPAGAATLRAYLEQNLEKSLEQNLTQPPTPAHRPSLPSSVTWVMGMMANKDHADVFRQLLRAGDRLYLVPVPDHLSADLEQLAALAIEVCPELAACCLTADAVSALHLAFQVPQQPAATVLCGSLYLIGHFFSGNSRSISAAPNR